MSTVIFDHNDGQTFELGSEGKKVKQLPAGIYYAEPGSFGRRYFTRVIEEKDKLIQLENNATVEVLKDIRQFLASDTKQSFKDYELLYRRGILLYGPPGTGKTSTVMQISEEFIKNHNGIVLLSFPFSQITSWIQDLRENDTDRPIMLVIEELDDRLESHESVILNLLDGHSSLDNLIVLATTNYIDEVPSRIKNRPSRFALVKEIGYPNESTRLAFLKERVLPKDQKTLDVKALASATEGFSIDHLKDLIISVCCFKLPVNKAVEKIREMINSDDDSEDD